MLSFFISLLSATLKVEELRDNKIQITSNENILHNFIPIAIDHQCVVTMPDQINRCAEIFLYTTGIEQELLLKILNYDNKEILEKMMIEALVSCINYGYLSSVKLLSAYMVSKYNTLIENSEHLLPYLSGIESYLQEKNTDEATSYEKIEKIMEEKRLNQQRVAIKTYNKNYINDLLNLCKRNTNNYGGIVTQQTIANAINSTYPGTDMTQPKVSLASLGQGKENLQIIRHYFNETSIFDLGQKLNISLGKIRFLFSAVENKPFTPAGKKYLEIRAERRAKIEQQKRRLKNQNAEIEEQQDRGTLWENLWCTLSFKWQSHLSPRTVSIVEVLELESLPIPLYYTLFGNKMEDFFQGYVDKCTPAVYKKSSPKKKD